MRAAIVLAVTSSLVACAERADPNSELRQESVTFQVEALTCEGCAWQIREVLGDLPGVLDVETTVNAKTVAVRFDARQVSAEWLVAALTQAHYIPVKVTQ